MPCRCDLPDPNERQLESKVVCGLLVKLYNELNINQPISDRLRKAAKDDYGSIQNLDIDTEVLCNLINGFSTKQKNEYLNWNNKKWRSLAAWWERHQEADEKRAKEERRAKRIEKIRQNALSKLTPAERRALDLE